MSMAPSQEQRLGRPRGVVVFTDEGRVASKASAQRAAHSAPIRSLAAANSKSLSEIPPAVVGRQRERYSAVADENVGVMLHRLGALGDAVDERHRGDEVLEAECPLDLLAGCDHSGRVWRRAAISASVSLTIDMLEV